MSTPLPHSVPQHTVRYGATIYWCLGSGQPYRAAKCPGCRATVEIVQHAGGSYVRVLEEPKA